MKMNIERLRKMLRKKDRLITIRINSDLLKLLDETITKDNDHASRNELIESLILQYLETKGQL